jgi:hypothetical protein
MQIGRITIEDRKIRTKEKKIEKTEPVCFLLFDLWVA